MRPGTAGHLATYLAARAVLAALRALPRSAGRRCGAALGRLLYALMPRRRAVTLANIERVYGAALPPDGRRRLARAAFAHLGAISADAAYFPRLRNQPVDHLARVEGVEHLRAAVALGKGVLAFSGHFGPWEQILLLQPRLGWPFAVIVRPLNNPYLDRHVERLRERAGNSLIPKRDAARGVLRALRDGRVVAIMIDQNVRGEAGVFVDFLGTPASTTPALATFALKTGAPILPVFAEPLPDGRALIRYQPAFQAERTDNLQDDIRRVTRRCTAMLEAAIRRRPECWFWMHNRWRTRPADEAAARAPRGAADAAHAFTRTGLG